MMKSKSFAARKSGDDGLRPELFDIVNGFLIDAVENMVFDRSASSERMRCLKQKSG